MEKINEKELANKIKNFIKQSYDNNFKTREYKFIYKDLETKASFGQGTKANVTWLAFLKSPNTVQKGIYPVLLFDWNNKCLIVAYGVSETKPSDFKWNINNKKFIKEFTDCKCDYIKNKYPNSYVEQCFYFKNIDDTKEIDEKLNKIIESLNNIINVYNKMDFSNNNDKGNTMNKDSTLEKIVNILTHKNQIIFQGPPGTGKTRLAKQIAIELIDSRLPYNTNEEIKNSFSKLDTAKIIQFHPSYSYEDFVRGIVAIVEGEKVKYEVEDKILAQMAKEALKNPNKTYVLIIDEINRANLSSVLGELIYALEYRGEVVESMYEKDNGRKIILPKNLYIIGTMNTADRSIGHIDYAIRRRFAFVDILPDESVIENEKAKELFEKIKEIFENNTSIDFDANDVMIGHSYFIVDDEKKLADKLEYEIKPLLLEYIKDGVLKQEAKREMEELEI